MAVGGLEDVGVGRAETSASRKQQSHMPSASKRRRRVAGLRSSLRAEQPRIGGAELGCARHAGKGPRAPTRHLFA
jgi:hypothetical protein